MRYFFSVLATVTIASQALSNDDRWADDISMRYGVVTEIDESGRFEVANGEFHFQLSDRFDWTRAMELLPGTALVCKFHNSLALFEQGYSIGVAPDCDVLTNDGNVSLEAFLED